jgi:heterodisulfide reductase subunit A
VYICHCGGNISDVVDVGRVADELATVEGVEVARHFMFMCSDEGQNLITSDIRERGLDRVVVAACTPSLHEATFRRAVSRAGLNPYLFQPANIREQVSWAHPHDPEGATAKAIALVRAAVAKARLLEPLERIRVPATRRALVVGGGIAGMKAALDLAQRGIAVTLVEKSPFLGGRAVQLGKVYPTEEEARILLTPLMQRVLTHPLIAVRTYTQVVALDGYVGDFRITLRTWPRGVTPELTDPTAAMAACPVEVPDEFNYGLGQRKAIYYPYPGCQPDLPAIDWGACTRCGRCAQAMGGRGIVLRDMPLEEEVRVGVIVMATGFDPYQPRAGEYGYGRLPGVITLPQLIRMLDPQGPTAGKLEWADRPVRSVVFIHCVGSRQLEGIDEPGPEGKLNTYCSRVCCAATLRAACEIRERFPQVQVYNIYRDIRTYEKAQERYYEDASRKGVLFIRYDPEAKPVVLPGDNFPLVVRVRDTLTFGEELEVPADLVVLSVGVIPRDIADLLTLTKLQVGNDGFLLEIHPKLRPVESAIPGILLAGTAQAPMDMSEASVAASAAAAKAAAILCRDHVEMEPFVARVDPDLCRGTGLCVNECEYQGAIWLEEVEVEGQRQKRARINPAVCKGCGACVAVCPHGAIQVQGWELCQFEAMVDAIATTHAAS